MIPKLFRLFAAVLFAACTVSAQEIKVDINNSGRPVSEGNDPTYTPWSTNQTWYLGGSSTSNSFNGVGVSLSVVFPVGAPFRTGYWKDGVQQSPPSGNNYNCKLAGDGLKVHEDNGGNSGGQIEMRLSGLSAGPHTLMTFHNTWEIGASNALINVFVNGVQAVTNLATTCKVTNSFEAATAYLNFDAVAGQDVVVRFEPNLSSTAAIKNIYLNGFEIDTANSILKSVSPVPFNQDEHVDADNKTVLLRWKPAGSAVSHDVYFGTSSNAVKNATHASPEFKVTQTTTNYFTTNLSSLLTYYWRVDEVNGVGGVTKGDLWMFRPRHLAFPGAEGYGRFARGGRGGVVIEVSNTNNSGPGSLRDALTANYGPRTVVFTVSGLITLESDLIISGNNPYITLAGQTAPGKGICTRKYQLGMSGGQDVIIRNVRSRPGDIAGVTLNGSGMSGSDHCIMDHVSISWGIDEELSTRTSKNVTFQRSLISEALNIAGHDHYGAGTRHGYAATVGGDIASLHHNLLAHNEGRNWSLGGGLDGNGYAGRLDIFNNVVYNWRSRTTDGGAHEVNFVNNYYKAGAASSQEYALNAQYGGFPGTQRYYFEGNVMTSGGGVSPGFGTNNQAAGKTTSTESGGTLPENSNPPYSAWVSAPFFPSYATIHPVTNAYKLVMSDVGCNQPQIDDHDVRVIRETIDGTYTYTGTGPYGGSPGLPNSQDDVGGWENYPVVQRPANFDTDHDGLPDWWETIKGFNINSPTNNFSDSNGDPDGDEYTNLEDYLNWLAAPHFDCTNGIPLDIDLTQFTRGFTNNTPIYTVSAPTNGSVTLVAGKTARFTLTVSTNALGSFKFTVTDVQGASLTNSVGIRIISATAPPAQPPILGIRNQSGALLLELTGENGRSLTVQSKTNVTATWVTWTNVTGSGALQLLPLNSLTNQTPRFFRAYAQ